MKHNPAVVVEWSRALVLIQVAISPLQTQVQFLLGTCMLALESRCLLVLMGGVLIFRTRPDH